MTTGSSPSLGGRSSSGGYDLLLAKQQQRRDIARLGAFAQHAKHDPHETTRGAFAARMRRFEQQVDPDGALARRDPQALARRVQAALNEEMARVRLARSKRALEKREAIERLRRTPPNKSARLDAAATAVAVTLVESAQISEELTLLEDLGQEVHEKTQQRAAQQTATTKVAPVGTKATPTRTAQRRNTQKFVSSDDSTGAATIAPTRRRRQTSTPKTTTGQPKVATSKKAATSNGNKRSHR